MAAYRPTPIPELSPFVDALDVFVVGTLGAGSPGWRDDHFV
jgi:hypothetical protein